MDGPREGDVFRCCPFQLGRHSQPCFLPFREDQTFSKMEGSNPHMTKACWMTFII